MTERMIDAGGVRLCVDDVGDPNHPAVLLIAGAATSMADWEPEFCARLAAAGRYVVRYDHRDTGRSQSWPAGDPRYTGTDLDTDPVRVLDALGVAAAHLVGMSAGGGIAQEVAARYPQRVLSLTLIATGAAGKRSSAADLPGPTPELAATFENPPPDPDWSDPEAVLDHQVAASWPYLGPEHRDEDRLRRSLRAALARTTDPEAAARNHWVLLERDDPQAPEPFRMAELDVPTLVLHGTADPLFPVEHGRALAAEIRGARLIELPGMGHEVPPPPLWDTVVAAIVEHTATAN